MTGFLLTLRGQPRRLQQPVSGGHQRMAKLEMSDKVRSRQNRGQAICAENLFQH